jgi:MoaA/NifB/PqqE/SkfB family radical SAM enzyme
MNFASRCNMRCRYCYIPFDGLESDIQLWRRIIDEIARLGAKAITFGGGDPMLYRDFRKLLLYTRSTPLFIHLDTNGLCVNDNDFALFQECVDLLGLPLDSDDAAIHGVMRSHARHYRVVMRLLEETSRRSIPVKINTVVSAMNLHSIQGIATIVNSFSVPRWSLYRFWPIGPIATSHASDFEVPESEFTALVEHMEALCPNSVVEKGSVEARHKAYFFVTHTGKAYSVDPLDSSIYVSLGSIFEEDVVKRWSNIGDRSLNARRSRSRMRMTVATDDVGGFLS